MDLYVELYDEVCDEDMVARVAAEVVRRRKEFRKGLTAMLSYYTGKCCVAGALDALCVEKVRRGSSRFWRRCSMASFVCTAIFGD